MIRVYAWADSHSTKRARCLPEATAPPESMSNHHVSALPGVATHAPPLHRDRLETEVEPIIRSIRLRRVSSIARSLQTQAAHRQVADTNRKGAVVQLRVT